MNCNTTHYRANSSSVPGDPTDSSRFWPANQHQPGINPPSFDKQFVRDYLETLDWDKTPPAPDLPAEIVAKTAEKYRQAYELLTGRGLS